MVHLCMYFRNSILNRQSITGGFHSANPIFFKIHSTVYINLAIYIINLCIPIDFKLGWYIVVLRDQRIKFHTDIVFLSLRIDFVIAHFADPDELPYDIVHDDMYNA